MMDRTPYSTAGRRRWFFVFTGYNGNAGIACVSYTHFPDNSIILHGAMLVDNDLRTETEGRGRLGTGVSGNLCRVEDGEVRQSWGCMGVREVRVNGDAQYADIAFIPATSANKSYQNIKYR